MCGIFSWCYAQILDIIFLYKWWLEWQNTYCIWPGSDLSLKLVWLPIPPSPWKYDGMEFLYNLINHSFFMVFESSVETWIRDHPIGFRVNLGSLPHIPPLHSGPEALLNTELKWLHGDTVSFVIERKRTLITVQQASWRFLVGYECAPAANFSANILSCTLLVNVTEQFKLGTLNIIFYYQGQLNKRNLCSAPGT